MPLRDDLLDPIAEDKPSGPDLRYDPVFDQIKEARREEDDTLPTGDWARTAKRADHEQVARLAGDTLATRTKDLRLAASLVESQVKLDGVVALGPSIAFLRDLQEKFWTTIYPEIDDGDLQLRVNEIERAARQLALYLKELPLTKSGLNPADYKESRAVGYEVDATTDDRKKNRNAAIEAKKITAEEFDRAASETPKAYFVQIKTELDAAIDQGRQLDAYQRETYGDQYPELAPLLIELRATADVADFLLAERRKVEPDPVDTLEKLNQLSGDPNAPIFSLDDHGGSVPGQIPSPGMDETDGSGQHTMTLPTQISGPQDAYQLIVSCAQSLFEADMRSPVPYLVCAGLRLGETRMQGPVPEPGFAVGPSFQIRQSLRSFASHGSWGELLRAALPVLSQPCARAWLDLHRYIWRGAQESGSGALAAAVCGTLRELLRLRPEVRHWTLEDDTGAANPETQAWIDSEVLGSGG